MRADQIPLSLVRPTIFCLLLASASVAFSQGTGFTYQGRLQDGGAPASGNYDLEFRLFDVQSGVTPPLATQQRLNVAVSAGVFTVTLDFGPSFPGGQRFLEIGVRPAGGSTFTTLNPRQPITSTPHAIRSLSAGTAETATNATQLGGVAASNYLQSVAKDSSLAGNGTSSSPLGITVPLQLTGSVNGRIISGTNNSSQGSGVYGFTNDSSDVNGGVMGEAPNGDGIVGRGGRAGVFGQSSAGVGVNGNSGSSFFAGVLGFNSSTGAGVRGLSDNGRAFWGSSANGFAGYFEGKSYFSSNVGIGTTSPVTQLHVIGNGLFTGILTVDTSLNALSISSLETFSNAINASVRLSINDSAMLQLRGPVDANHGIRYSSVVDGPEFRAFSGFRWTNGSNGAVERMRLDGDGNLQVNGQGRFNTVLIGTYPTGQNIGLCTASSGINQNVVGLCSSSLRYKSNVQSFRKGLDIIRRLQPISFDWKEAGTHDVGLAAEEVDKVEPLLTFRNDKGEVEGVKYNQLSAAFINAFKEQQAQIDQQQGELKQQRSLIEQQSLLINNLRRLVCRRNARAAICRR